MGLDKGNYSFMNAIIEFNMIASPNPWNLNQIEIWIQIGAAGIRTERNHWSERKSETFIIKNLMSHWTFIKSREIQYNLLLKPLRVDSLPINDHEKWIQDLISLIFVEKTTHSLNARWSRLLGVVGNGPAAHVSNFYFPNCACGKLQTKSLRSAN